MNDTVNEAIRILTAAVETKEELSRQANACYRLFRGISAVLAEATPEELAAILRDAEEIRKKR